MKTPSTQQGGGGGGGGGRERESAMIRKKRYNWSAVISKQGKNALQD